MGRFQIGRHICQCGNKVITGTGNLAQCATCRRKGRHVHRRVPGGDRTIEHFSPSVLDMRYRVNLDGPTRSRLRFDLEAVR